MKIFTYSEAEWNKEKRIYETVNAVTEEYEGEVALCKGGGSTSTTNIDYEYNRRMAAIAEEQQGMAKWYMDWMKGEGVRGPSFIDLEEAKIAENMRLLPAQTGLGLEQIGAERSLLPGQTALAGEQIGAARQLLPGQTKLAGEQIAGGIEKTGYQRELMPAYFNKVTQGLDVKSRMGTASAEVVKAYSGMEDQARRQAARMGMSPASSQTLSRLTDVNLNRSRDIALARTRARTTAEQENLVNMRQAMTL